MGKDYFYAVGRGRQIGVYKTWAECEKNVKGFPSAKFKKFSLERDALDFINQWKTGNTMPSTSQPVKQEVFPSTYRNIAPSPDTPVQKLQKRKFASSPSTPDNSNRNGLRKTQLLESPLPKYFSKKLRLDSPNIKGLKSLDGEKEYLPFIIDDEGYVNVYTDGACQGNGKTNPKAGVGVWFGDDHPLNISQPVDGPPTNNTAEIQAARLAIEIAESAGFEKLRINTDSAFLIQCVLSYVPKWKRNGWKLTNGQNVKNRLELEKLDETQKTVLVEWTKVPAHSGIHGNEMADKLANEGAQRYKNSQ